ncbi:hypothetical protein ACHAXT_003299 [Thalassiosira profunda]
MATCSATSLPLLAAPFHLIMRVNASIVLASALSRAWASAAASSSSPAEEEAINPNLRGLADTSHVRRLGSTCVGGLLDGDPCVDDTDCKTCSQTGRSCSNNGDCQGGSNRCDGGVCNALPATDSPTGSPTGPPTGSPTKSGTKAPTVSPTKNPTSSPTGMSTPTPSKSPSRSPSTTPSVSPTKRPSVAPVSTSPKTSAKRGLIIGGQAVQSSAEHFNDSISWFYNYKQAPVTGWQADWARQNNVEFVPMFSKDWLNNPDGSKRCKFVDTVNAPCTTQDAIDVIGETIATSSLTIKYVMGFNEMYNNGPPEDMTPAEAALYWARFVQPAAQAHGLGTVSPTLNKTPQAIRWFSDFLRECDALKNRAINPCDVDLIDKFAIHQYDCREQVWRDWYGGDTSVLITELKNNLGGKWSKYLKARPLWITETNCYWEVLDIGDRYPHPDSKGQCERTAGKLQSSHGQGSIATMEEMVEVERYSWWTLWNPQIKPNMLTYKAGQLTPAGRAYNTSVDCEYPGTKIYPQSATLAGTAALFQCETGGSDMIKDLGNGGTATFTVDVVGGGSHAINVAFVTAATRNLSVGVNGGQASQYEFVPSGEWCGNGGPSTVLPIEVDGFVDGTNTITFGQSNENEPIIEWFSIVDESTL